MKKKMDQNNSRQILFKDLFVGTLIYAVVLGFFNDYTDIITAKSFSTIFLAAFVLQLLTYSVFWLKKKVVIKLKPKKELKFKLVMIFGVWLIMFSSKFVFIGTIDLIFGDNMNVSGFVGILLVALSATIAARLSDLVFEKLD